MLTHLLIFRAAMVRQIRDLPDAFRAMPRDFVRIAEPDVRTSTPDEALERSRYQGLAAAVLTPAANVAC